ncbi:metallophosphoesterase family protein, partial [Candidatus Riflebacteria bacterium]
MQKVDKKQKYRIGVISDTHHLLRPEAQAALKGVDYIIHAGDIGTPEILASLQKIARVVPVRGNMDKGIWAKNIPWTEAFKIDEISIFLLHNLGELDLEPDIAGFDVIISGHTHQAKIKRKGKVLFLNPGSAGPARGSLPVTLAILSIKGKEVEGEIIV